MNKQIVLLGMHRSGTSMVAGVLEKLGINMGDKLGGKAVSNPLGHFEDASFVHLNEAILSKAGGNWSNPPSVRSILELENIFSDRISKLIKRKNKKELWGWKDPRTCLTMSLYEKHLTNFYIIVCSRDKKDICKSLKKRNGFSPEKSMKLILDYELRIDSFLRSDRRIRRLFIKYEDALENPSPNIRRLVDFLQLEEDLDKFVNARDFILPREKLEELVFNFTS